MYKHILIPTDGSPASLRAAKAGVELARAIGARVTAFFAAPTADAVIYDGLLPVGYMPPDQHAEIIERAAAKYLGAIADLAKAAGVPCESVHVTSDFPAEAILETREAAQVRPDLHGLARPARTVGLLLGSETQKVLTHSKIPVVVYR